MDFGINLVCRYVYVKLVWPCILFFYFEVLGRCKLDITSAVDAIISV